MSLINEQIKHFIVTITIILQFSNNTTISYLIYFCALFSIGQRTATNIFVESIQYCICLESLRYGI